MPQKLGPRYFGPYPVVAKVGSVAYKLQLPPEAKIHDVFHVSQLKAYHGKSPPIAPGHPRWWEYPEKQPLRIIDRRMVKKGNTAAAEILIHWKGEEEAAATWEDFQASIRKYPQLT